jgi:hypothetical protein
MIDAGKVGERRDVLVTEKHNVVFHDLTLVPSHFYLLAQNFSIHRRNLGL